MISRFCCCCSFDLDKSQTQQIVINKKKPFIDDSAFHFFLEPRVMSN